MAAQEFKAALEQFDFLLEHSNSFDNKISALTGRLTTLEKMDVKMRNEINHLCNKICLKADIFSKASLSPK